MRILIRIIALPLSRFILPIALSLVVGFSSTQAQPVISSVSPTQNDTNGDPAADVTVTFNENVLVGAAGTFVVHGSFSGNRTGSGVYGGGGTTTLSFNPTTDFNPGEEVEIILTTGIQNTSVVSLAVAFVWKYIAAAGTGAADFSDTSTFGTGSDDTQAVVFADVDGDGDLDILVGNGGVAALANTVALNDGTGTFTAGTTFGTGADDTYALAVGDVDGDGDLDVAVGNLSAQNTVYLNNGSGSFTDGSNNFGPGDDETRSMVFGDVDGDGDLDIMVGNGGGASNPNDNRVYLNDGSGDFSSSIGLGSANGLSYAVVLGDIDGDGDLDLVEGNLNDQNVFRLNDGSGSFGSATNVGPSGDATLALALGDVDGDGDVDLVVGNDLEQNVIYLNDGAGDFTAGTVNFGTGSDQTYSLVFADVDGDGDLDLIVGNEDEQNVAYLNDGTGSFGTSSNFGTGSDATMAVAAGDVDGNNTLDIAVGNASPNVVYLNSLSVPSETTPAAGLSGASTVVSGGEVRILSIGLTGDGASSTVSAIDLTVSDTSTPTGLETADFTALRLYTSTDAVLDGSDTLIGSVSTVNIGTATTVSANTPDEPPTGSETFYLVSAVVSSTPGHAFTVAFAAGGVSTSGGGIGTAFAASDANSVTIAEQADPQGVSIRLIEPEDGDIVAIGDSVIVQVITLPGISDLDTVIVGMSSGIGASKFGDLGPVDTLTAPTSTSSSADSFLIGFEVAAGDTQIISSTNIVQALVSVSGDGVGLKLIDNQSSFEVVANVEDFGLVGDQKTFGIDGLRPLTTGFDSVMVDTGALTNTGDTIFGTRATTDGADGTTQLVRSFKLGDEVKVLTHVDVSNFDITEIESVKVYLVDMVTAGYAVPDSAFYTMSYSAVSFLGSGGVMRDSFIVEEGQFESGSVSDNVRVGALGFFVDKAGNLSAATSNAASEAAFSQDIYTVADSKKPEITLIRPVESGDRFTGLIDTTMTELLDDGTTASNTFSLLPLLLTTDEGTSSILAIVEDDTAFYAGNNALDTLAFATSDSFSSAPGEVSGATVDLTLSATDSVGNATDKTLAGVILDQEMPVPQNLFPASSALDTSVITELTRHPKFTAAEALDSAQVKFVEITSGTPEVVSASLSAVDAGLVSVTVTADLTDDVTYAFQVRTTDLAGNTYVTGVDTLTFDPEFANPEGDSFVVALDSTLATVDSVIAGVNMPIKITAIDTALSNAEGKLRPAVTFDSDSVTVRAVAGDQDISGVRFAGTGVTDNGDGTATLDGEGWQIGERTILVTSEKVLNEFAVVVEYESSTGQLESLTVDAAEFRSFNVSVVEDEADGDSATGVSGPFNVSVKPADRFGNPSLKVFNGNMDVSNSDSLTASANLLASRVPDENLLGSIWVELGSNNGDVRVPAGPQKIEDGGLVLQVGGAGESGQGLVISARSVGAPSDTTGVTLPRTVAYGATPELAFAVEGEVPVIVEAIANPDTLVVQDYKGSNGQGDQGSFVLMTFPRVDDARVTHYRISRELLVRSRLDEDGSVVASEAPVLKFIPWVIVLQQPVNEEGLVRAVVATLDNNESRWAVSSEAGGTSERESIKPAVSLKQLRQLAIGSWQSDGSLLTEETIANYLAQFDGLRVARFDPQLPLISVGRTKQAVAGRTISEVVGAVDDIAPAAVTNASVSDGTVTWELSVDDRPVGFVPYRGFAIPIPGVKRYQILGGTSEETLEVLVDVAAGSVTASVNSNAGVFRVDALDDDNTTPGETIAGVGMDLVDADGNPVIIIVTDGDTPLTTDFEDFLAFAGSFNKVPGEEGYNARADINDDGLVDFADFLAFAGSFGRTAVDPDGGVATKPLVGGE